MRVSPEIYNSTITVINKLDAKDAALSQDAYYKTILAGCMWSDSSTRTVGSDGTVSIATSHRVQIPEMDNYMPYREWMQPENRDTKFTVREGDYVVLGEVTEAVTPSNVRSIVKQFEPEAFQVQSFQDCTFGDGFNSSDTGWLRFAEVLSIEG